MCNNVMCIMYVIGETPNQNGCCKYPSPTLTVYNVQISCNIPVYANVWLYMLPFMMLLKSGMGILINGQYFNTSPNL